MNSWLSVTTLALIKGFAMSVNYGIHHLPEDNIVGGALVSDIKQQPYMVSININSANDWWFLCGGSLISQYFVVTACHCLAGFKNNTGPAVPLDLPMDDWLFVAGTVRLDMFDKMHQQRYPESLRHHPKCTVEEVAKYDIAVAKMYIPFEITEYVKPARILSYEAKMFEEQFAKMRGLPPKCLLSGWGINTEKMPKTREEIRQMGIPFPNTSSKPESNQLKTVTTYIVDTGRCWTYIRGLEDDDAFEEDGSDLEAYKQICITSHHSDKGFCTGDSGFPLICNGQLVAVASYSLECGSVATVICQKATVLLEWLGRELCADDMKCRTTENTMLRAESQAEFHSASPLIVCQLIIYGILWIMIN